MSENRQEVGEGVAFTKYGARHKALRVGWARKVAAGGVVCARCGQLIELVRPGILATSTMTHSVGRGRSIGVVTARRRKRGCVLVVGRR